MEAAWRPRAFPEGGGRRRRPPFPPTPRRPPSPHPDPPSAPAHPRSGVAPHPPGSRTRARDVTALLGDGGGATAGWEGACRGGAALGAARRPRPGERPQTHRAGPGRSAPRGPLLLQRGAGLPDDPPDGWAALRRAPAAERGVHLSGFWELARRGRRSPAGAEPGWERWREGRGRKSALATPPAPRRLEHAEKTEGCDSARLPTLRRELRQEPA
ncbi:uncharacterized protein [Equus caballus]|uniref:uncharacterized protein n=1 Tax=Equus caballus TaxID=9796 RepID=UPI0038B2F017